MKFESKGKLKFDPGKGTKHFCDWWCLLMVDEGIINLYCWWLNKKGILIEKNKLWGPHISVVKGTEPPNKSVWGLEKTINFEYDNYVKEGNGLHCWLEVHSEELNEVRVNLGLEKFRRFHLTIGRILN